MSDELQLYTKRCANNQVGFSLGMVCAPCTSHTKKAATDSMTPVAHVSDA